MKNCKSTILLATYALLTIGTLSAQKTPSEYIETYQNEYSVRLIDHSFTDIGVKKGKVEINNSYYQKNLFLDKSASDIGNITLQYNPPFTSITAIKAYSMVPKADDNEYSKEKVRSIEDKEIISNDIFYGGNRAKIFSYPSLQKGAITVLEYNEKIVEPKLAGSEIFQSFSVVEDQQFELTHDNEIALDIKYFNCTEEDFFHSASEKGGRTTHRWIPKEYSKIKSESSMPEFLRVMPHIVYRIVSYNDGEKEVPVLRNSSDLYAWYQSLMIDVNRNESDEIKKLTDSITANEILAIDKTNIIFEWVQDHIKYIAFEDGLGGFKPRLPSDVFNKRFGDCKDMSCLVVNMLQHAGVPAYHTWIGTRRLPYTYSDVPSPLADNHMIVCAMIDGKPIYLDPTNSDLPFPLPSSFIQGKEALIGISTDSFAIKTVPIVAAEENVIYDSAFIELNNLALSGTGIRNYKGYYADFINGRLHNKNQDDLTDLLKAHVRKGNNKCNSSGYNLNKTKKQTSVAYEFNVPHYAYQHQDQIFINLNLEKVLSDFKVKDDRQYPLEQRFAYKMIRHFSMKIPEGYAVSYLPQNTESMFEDFGFSLSYTLINDTINYDLEIEINSLEIQKKDFEDWNLMIRDLNKNYNTSLTLSKK
ncbi:DUF3857 domain-containing protein [Owenweeksia hongkongensis]|uniref:DUF3857 domain-containing protein n=1 Tax=Owenweeksia hongkongensis TaxID=253245 RepID=UPI003A909D48